MLFAKQLQSLFITTLILVSVHTTGTLVSGFDVRAVPPSNGSYVISHLERGKHDGLFMSMKDRRDNIINLYTTLVNQETFITTVVCKELTKYGCNTPSPYDTTDSQDNIIETNKQLNAWKYNARETPWVIGKYAVNSDLYNGQFRLMSSGQKYNTSVTVPFYAIKTSNPTYESSHDGQIGLQPNLNAQQHSFYKELKYEYNLQYDMFSIYMATDKNSNSSIMFGSWNPYILKQGEPLQMIKTVDSGKWSVHLNDFVFMNEKIDVATRRNPNPTILFEPSVPYIQIPPNDWNTWYSKINERISISLEHSGLCQLVSPCSSRTGHCKFPNTCQRIQKCIPDINVQFQIYDKNATGGIDSSYNFRFNVSDLLINGTDIVGDTEDGRTSCYLSLMKQTYRGDGFPYANQWIIGRTIYRSHYIVYDMTPQQSDTSLNYNRIGIAVKGDVRALYDEYKIYWNEKYIIISAVALALIILAAIIVFITCKIKSRKLDERMNLIFAYNDNNNQMINDQQKIFNEVLLTDERKDSTFLNTERLSTQPLIGQIEDVHGSKKTQKNKYKRREYLEVNTSEDDSLKSSSGEENQNVRASSQQVQPSNNYGINRASNFDVRLDTDNY